MRVVEAKSGTNSAHFALVSLTVQLVVAHACAGLVLLARARRCGRHARDLGADAAWHPRRQHVRRVKLHTLQHGLHAITVAMLLWNNARAAMTRHARP